MPWSHFPELARFYRCIETVLHPTWEKQARPPSSVDRALAFAAAAYQHHHPRQAALGLSQYEQLSRCFLDKRVRVLPVQRRHLLLYLTGAGLGMYLSTPDRARELVARGLELSRFCWVPSEWQPWMGPLPESRPRQAVMLLTGPDEELEASGDPEDEVPRWQLEPRRDGRGELGAVSIAMVLQGIDHWQAVVEQHLKLDLGAARLGARVALEQLVALAKEPDAEPWMKDIRDWMEAA